MKLVELLVKELEGWPEGVTYFVQDGDREVKAGDGSELAEPLAYPQWIRGTPLSKYNFYSSLCTDWKTSIVTKDIYTKHKEVTQMKITTLEDAKVGDKVWDTRKGWGVVDELRYSNEYPILVNFGHDYESYTLDGYYFEDDVNPSLFWDEIVIEAPPKPLPDLPVDAKVLVWCNGDELKLERHFSHFKDGDCHTFDGGRTSWTGESTSAWVNWELSE